MLARRMNYASKLGISIEDYLVKEAFNDEKTKIMKNCKKKSNELTNEFITPNKNI